MISGRGCSLVQLVMALRWIVAMWPRNGLGIARIVMGVASFIPGTFCRARDVSQDCFVPLQVGYQPARPPHPASLRRLGHYLIQCRVTAGLHFQSVLLDGNATAFDGHRGTFSVVTQEAGDGIAQTVNVSRRHKRTC